MGLFDYFTAEGKLKRHARRMSDRDAQPEDRDASARWLADEGSPKAILALLTRFDMRITQDMKDRAEKQFTFDLLRSLGDDVVTPLRAWLKKCKHYAWPLKLMVETEGEDAAVEVVFSLLDGPVGKASFEPERRKELLIWLAERQHTGVIEAVTPFLDDFDEEVRYAAAECVVKQEDDAGRPLLLAILANPKEESIRLKHRIAGVFKTRGWSVDDAELGGVLPDGFDAVDGRIVGA